MQNNKDTIFVISEQNFPRQNKTATLYKDESKKKSGVYSLFESDYNEKRKIEKRNSLKKICLLILVCFLDFVSITYSELNGNLNLHKEISNGLLFIGLTTKIICNSAFFSFNHQKHKII